MDDAVAAGVAEGAGRGLGEASAKGVDEGGGVGAVDQIGVVPENPFGGGIAVGDDGEAAGGGFDVDVAEGFVAAEVEENIAAAVDVGHAFHGDGEAVIPFAEKLGAEGVGLGAQGAVAGEEKVDIGKGGDGADAVEGELGGDEGADHADDAGVVGKSEFGAFWGGGGETRCVDAVGDEGGAPALAVAFKILGIGADEGFAAEQAVFTFAGVGGPVAVFGDVDVLVLLFPAFGAQEPVDEGVAAGDGEIVVGGPVEFPEGGAEAEFFPAVFGAEGREAGPFQERFAGTDFALKIAVGAVWNLRAGADEGDVEAFADEPDGDVFKRGLCPAGDAVQAGECKEDAEGFHTRLGSRGCVRVWRPERMLWYLRVLRWPVAASQRTRMAKA